MTLTVAFLVLSVVQEIIQVCWLALHIIRMVIQAFLTTEKALPWGMVFHFISSIPYLIHNFHDAKTWLYFQTSRKIIMRAKNIFLSLSLFPDLCLNNFKFT